MKKMYKVLSVIVLGFLLASCGMQKKDPDVVVSFPDSSTIQTDEIDGNTSGNTAEEFNQNQVQSTGAVDVGMQEIDETEDKLTKLTQEYRFTNGAEGDIVLTPIDHATVVMEWGGETVYVDPAEPIEGQPEPTVVVITHEHGDHLNEETLKGLTSDGVVFIVSKTVYEQIPTSVQAKAIVMENGETINRNGFKITAVPAYNIREEALQYHPEGKGNGYVFERDTYKVYFSGDTEDTPELRSLTDIDVAFVSMNLPYTMSVESAIDATLDFAPRHIFPYHYRGTDGLSDIERFKSEVESQNPNIEVILADWYPDGEETESEE